MLAVRQCSANRGRVADKFVGDHDPRLGARLPVEHTTQEALGGYSIAPLLHQDVQNDSVLANGSPQPVTFAMDLQRSFVLMPLIAGSHSSSTQRARKRGSELGAPLADRLVADDDVALGEEILNIAKAEVEAKVEPDGVGDHVRREAVTTVGRRRVRGTTRHRARLPAAQP